jgi:hypothetical protein
MFVMCSNADGVACVVSYDPDTAINPSGLPFCKLLHQIPKRMCYGKSFANLLATRVESTGTVPPVIVKVWRCPVVREP